MRRQNPLVFNADISQNDGGSEKLTHRPADLDESITQLCSRLTTDAQDSSANDNICCIEEYLADPLEGGSVNSDFLIDSNLKQSSNVLQVPANDPKDATDSKKNTSEFHDKNYAVPEVDAPLILSKQDEMNLKEKLTHDFEQVKAQEAQNVDELQPNQCLNNESHSSVDHASKKVQCNCTGVRNARGSCGDACKYFPELPLEHTQISQAYEDYGENIEATSNEHVDNTTHDPEASQHQRGMSRRCLQFEEAPSKTTWTRNNPCNFENIVTSRTAGTAAESETLNSSLVVCSATSSSSRLFNVVQPVATGSHSRNSGISSIHVSKPSGIGLHLNSIVNAVPMSRGATASIKLSDGYLSGQGMMSASTMNCHAPEDIKKGSKLSNVFAKVSAGTEDRVLDSDVSVAVASAIPEPLRTMEPLNLRQPNEHHETPQSKSKFIPDNSDSFEELSQQSPKKKKKKLLNISDGGGCKRCNCKKSKCLKLYCECFAAGIYCAEPCACQGCFNRPECKDMVLDTRQQIESRNPLAFVPKVIKLVSESANDWEEGSTMTPSSARHKRGCNCKKSMCLKKYCECYQANVGCSDACRCEGCKNIYGRKAVYGVTEEVVRHRASNERSEAISDSKMEIIMASKKHAEFHDMHRFTPLTPSFQFSDHGQDAPMSRLIRRNYLPSPDSDPTILKVHSKSPESPKYSDEYDMIHETAKDTSEAGLYGQAIDYSNADMAGVFSSTNDFLTDICPPPPNPPSITMASSASSKASECTNLSQSQLCSGGQCLSSTGALRWRSSPITPMAQLGGSKSPKGLDADNGFYSILEDTPEILQDASTPSESVKVSSPNRKRVSPPYGRLHELGSSATGALKSGRKFILKAVPSFPPLTPCMESKGISNQSSNDSQHTRKK